MYLSSSFILLEFFCFLSKMNVVFFRIFLQENMFLINIFIIQSIFWDMSSYISNGDIIMMYTMTSTLSSIQASTIVFMSSRVAVLCYCFKSHGSLNKARSPSWCVHFPRGVTRKLNPVRHALNVHQSFVLCLSSSFLDVIHYRRDLRSYLVRPPTSTKSSRATMANFCIFAHPVFQQIAL